MSKTSVPSTPLSAWKRAHSAHKEIAIRECMAWKDGVGSEPHAYEPLPVSFPLLPRHPSLLPPSPHAPARPSRSSSRQRGPALSPLSRPKTSVGVSASPSGVWWGLVSDQHIPPPLPPLSSSAIPPSSIPCTWRTPLITPLYALSSAFWQASTLLTYLRTEAPAAQSITNRLGQQGLPLLQTCNQCRHPPARYGMRLMHIV
jgi:hypothetical protein